MLLKFIVRIAIDIVMLILNLSKSFAKVIKTNLGVKLGLPSICWIF